MSGQPAKPHAEDRAPSRLFVAAALAEIGGAYLVWVAVKDHRGWVFLVLGAMALTVYGVVAAFQPSHQFGQVLAGAAICLLGVAVIRYAR